MKRKKQNNKRTILSPFLYLDLAALTICCMKTKKIKSSFSKTHKSFNVKDHFLVELNAYNS